MICVVWCLSALVSLPTLLYPPWRIPFKKPSNTKIYLHEQDRIFLNSINGTKELAHHKCSVSFLNILVLIWKDKYEWDEWKNIYSNITLQNDKKYTNEIKFSNLLRYEILSVWISWNVLYLICIHTLFRLVKTFSIALHHFYLS